MTRMWKFQRDYIIFLIILFTIGSPTPGKSSGTLIKKPPEMRLTQHMSNLSRSTKLGHKTDFVIQGNFYRVDVTCEAEYPITFTFPHPQNAKEMAENAEASNIRISNWDNPDMTPVSTKFKRQIKIHLGRVSFSLNISCVPVDHNIQISHPSVHLYRKGKHSIENQGDTLHISAKPSNNPPLVLPCRPANPNMKVVLEKKTVNKNAKMQTWRLFNLSENHVTFEPKVGFTFRNDDDDLSQDILGLYKCSVKENTKTTSKTPFVILNVTKSNSTSSVQDLNFVPRSKLVGNASAHVLPPDKDYKGQWFQCCSGNSDTPLQMYMVCSYEPFEAQVARASILKDIADGSISPLGKKFKRNDCYKAGYTHQCVSVRVVCQGENIDFVEEFINVFLPVATGLVTNRSDNAMKFAEPQKLEISAHQFIGSADLKTAPVSQKIMLTVLRHITTERAGKLSKHSHLFCDKQVLSTANKSHPVNVKLLEYDRDCYYEGEEMIFLCLGGKLLYADGGHLRLNWKNGTKTILNPARKDFFTMSCSGPGSKVGIGGKVHLSGNRYLSYEDSTAEAKFGTVLANPEMASVECWMPQGDCAEWDKISKSLTISPSTAPKFAEMENEVVNFTKGEKWKLITCSVDQGLPLPTVTVTKDGIPLRKDLTENIKFQSELLTKYGMQITVGSYWDNENHRKELSVGITFPEIKSNHDGVYECKAINHYKMTTRTIKLSVTP